VSLTPGARDLKIDPLTGDLVIENGDLAQVSGTDAILQSIRTRLGFFLGEWFLDEAQGIPYFESILVKNPNFPAVRELLRRALLETPGVLEVTSLRLRFTSSTRLLAVSFRVSTDLGELAQTLELTTP
jgi:hypothetical protein